MQGNGYVDKFRSWGDFMTFLPLYAAGVSALIGDYEGATQSVLGAVTAQIVIEGVKRSFELAANNGHPVQFSFRPDGIDPKGMPSGHSGGGFSGAAYIFHRYGWKLGVPATLLAVSVAASRVVAKRHTIPQVIVGGLIGWGISYAFTSKYKKAYIAPYVDSDMNGNQSYGITIQKRF